MFYFLYSYLYSSLSTSLRRPMIYLNLSPKNPSTSFLPNRTIFRPLISLRSCLVFPRSLQAVLQNSARTLPTMQALPSSASGTHLSFHFPLTYFPLKNTGLVKFNDRIFIVSILRSASSTLSSFAHGRSIVGLGCITFEAVPKQALYGRYTINCAIFCQVRDHRLSHITP